MELILAYVCDLSKVLPKTRGISEMFETALIGQIHSFQSIYRERKCIFLSSLSCSQTIVI